MKLAGEGGGGGEGEGAAVRSVTVHFLASVKPDRQRPEINGDKLKISNSITLDFLKSLDSFCR